METMWLVVAYEAEEMKIPTPTTKTNIHGRISTFGCLPKRMERQGCSRSINPFEIAVPTMPEPNPTAANTAHLKIYKGPETVHEGVSTRFKHVTWWTFCEDI